ncbi:MAG TPA: biopolymer transporter ExbD [Thermoanaerobaculia bacterium]|nr:biopolymer transporter ExbD [Thermoanaerobaculia bacterium]
MRATRTSMHSEINVTPLVDVCLVLLIIFMIAIPTMVNGVDVQLPETSVKNPVDSRVFPVTVKEDGTVYLDTQIVRRDEVLSTLRRLHAKASTRPIAVRADKRVEYGEVAAVLGACREAGWVEVALVSTTPTSTIPPVL